MLSTPSPSVQPVTVSQTIPPPPPVGHSTLNATSTPPPPPSLPPLSQPPPPPPLPLSTLQPSTNTLQLTSPPPPQAPFTGNLARLSSHPLRLFELKHFNYFIQPPHNITPPSGSTWPIPKPTTGRQLERMKQYFFRFARRNYGNFVGNRPAGLASFVAFRNIVNGGCPKGVDVEVWWRILEAKHYAIIMRHLAEWKEEDDAPVRARL
jgi:hypothetical protein